MEKALGRGFAFLYFLLLPSIIVVPRPILALPQANFSLKSAPMLRVESDSRPHGSIGNPLAYPKDGSRRMSRAAEEAGEPIPAAPPPEEPAARAELILLCPPGSEVFIDGQLFGLERGRASLPSGSHRGACGASDVADAFDVEVSLSSGEKRELDFSRRKRAASSVSMIVLCPGGLPVFVDDRLLGVERATSRVTPGRHSVRCGSPQDKQLEHQVEVREGDLNEFDFSRAQLKHEQEGGSSTALRLIPEQVFERAAPATVFLVRVGGRDSGLGSGAVVDPKGLLVTNRHVVEGLGSSAKLYAFLFDPTERTLPVDVEDFVRTHRDRALEARVIRAHASQDLALVQLPERSEPYPSLTLGDAQALRVGHEVAAIGNPDGLTWTLTTGTISQLRKGSIQHQAPINPGNSGGPLLNLRGELIGINTFVRNSVETRNDSTVAMGGLGFAIPVNEVSAFLTEPEKPVAKSQPQEGRKDSFDVSKLDVTLWTQFIELVFSELIPSSDEEKALRVASDLLVGLASEGRTGFTVSLDGGELSVAITRALAQLTPEQGRQMTEVIEHTWPRAGRDAAGRLWVRSGVIYRFTAQVVDWDVDDVTGKVFFVESSGSAYVLDRKEWTKYDLGLNGVQGIEATDEVAYASMQVGGLYAISANGQKRISSARFNGQLYGSQGHLYYLSRDSNLYHFHGDWEAGGQAIISGLKSLVAAGPDWYGTDGGNRIYAGKSGKYIDEDGDSVGLWMFGKELISVSRHFRMFIYDPVKQRWRESKS